MEELSRLNPQWSDETLYQEGRRIVSAVQQHITWNEFLPRVLGWNAINLYELNLGGDGYYHGYDEKCNPTILNEFATGAFRFGHSLLKGWTIHILCPPNYVDPFIQCVLFHATALIEHPCHVSF